MAGERDRDPRRVPRRVQEVPEIAPRVPRRTGAGGTGRGGISEARAYTPRGRTVRETGPARSSDSDRPALRLVAGGPAEPSTAEEPRTPRARSTATSRKAATAGGPLNAG